MTEMLVYDCLVTICCEKIEDLLSACQGAYVGDEMTNDRLGVQIESDRYTLFTPIFYCPYCGKKIVVSQVEEE